MRVSAKHISALSLMSCFLFNPTDDSLFSSNFNDVFGVCETWDVSIGDSQGGMDGGGLKGSDKYFS